MASSGKASNSSYAYAGRYLDVDLSSGVLNDYEIPSQWNDAFLGGRGIGVRILLEELHVGVHPLEPENILVFATGPLQGSGFPGAGRHAIIGKSPKNRTINESYCGGFWGDELGQSGYDGIIIRGRSEKPVYLLIQNGRADILPAADIWGQDVGTTDQMLKEKHPGVRVTAIGPAGENLVMFACVIADRNRAAGRPAFGAVMGSKRLKAIAIRGDSPKTFADPSALKSLSVAFARELTQNPANQRLNRFGSAVAVPSLSELGILPTKNFREGSFAHADLISGEALRARFNYSKDTCAGCPVACKTNVCGSFQGETFEKRYGGPEYETVAAFGSLCLNSDLAAICLANQECNRLGLDTIGTGVAIAFAMEASEAGFLKEKITWGDPQAIVKLVRQIAQREGIGALLADGVEKAAKELNCEHLAMVIKGQEIPMHEPRGKVGLGISYATSPRGATHLEGFHDTVIENLPPQGIPELGLYKSLNRLELDGKAQACKAFEDYFSFLNSAIICANITFSSVAGPHNPIPRILEALKFATGRDISPENMMRIGERNYILRTIIAKQDGYTRRDDGLPLRFYQPLEGGTLKGVFIDKTRFEQEVQLYYTLRGLDEVGPSEKKLKELGLLDLLDATGSTKQRSHREPIDQGSKGECKS